MIFTGGGDDLIGGWGSNDTIDAGAGRDVFVLRGLRDGYSIATEEGWTVIRDIDAADGDDGTDRLLNVEALATTATAAVTMALAAVTMAPAAATTAAAATMARVAATTATAAVTMAPAAAIRAVRRSSSPIRSCRCGQARQG